MRQIMFRRNEGGKGINEASSVEKRMGFMRQIMFRRNEGGPTKIESDETIFGEEISQDEIAEGGKLARSEGSENTAKGENK